MIIGIRDRLAGGREAARLGDGTRRGADGQGPDRPTHSRRVYWASRSTIPPEVMLGVQRIPVCPYPRCLGSREEHQREEDVRRALLPPEREASRWRLQRLSASAPRG